MRLLVEHLKRYAWIYLIAFSFLAAANVIYAYFPKLLGEFTDELKLNGLTQNAIERYSLLLLAIGIGYGVLFGIGQYLNHRMGRRFEYNSRQKLFQHFTRLSEQYYSRNGIGKLLSYMMNDVSAVRESIANGANQLTNASVLLLSVVVMLSLSNIPAYLILVCIIPLLSIPIMVVYIGPVIKERSKKVQESLAEMTESAEEQFGGIRVTKTFAIEGIAQRRFGEKVEQIKVNQLKLVRITAIFQAMIPFVGALSLVVAIIFGGYLTIQGKISLGDFVMLTFYLRMIVNPLQQIGNVINTMQRARASLDRLNRLLAVRPDIREIEEAKVLSTGESDIVISGLSFTYPEAGRTSLEGINLHLPQGKTLGIVGKTGSGKTTLMKLLLRIYDAPRGTVFIGGNDLLDLTLESLRTQIAYVPQDGFLFSTTIRDNIAFFDRKVGNASVENAAKLAEVYDNVIGFSERFETKLGERGLTLSGGQRQRTSIARGLIKDAPILILDDSVSAVDAITETTILENLRKVRSGKTTLVVAHRISAVKHADEIIVLDEGRIIERGTHQELIGRRGYYAELHEIQEEGASHG